MHHVKGPCPNCALVLPGPEGFRLALSLVFRLVVKGLLWEAPTCSSFVFANSSRTGRNASNYGGDLDYPAVQSGNLQAQVAMFLFAVATRRGATAVIENPAGSMIFNYEPVRAGLAAHRTHVQIADGCAYNKKTFGLRSRKAFKFVASEAWISQVSLRCKCPNGLHVELMTTNEDGQVSGTPQLKASQAYPPSMGAAIVRAWESWRTVEAKGSGMAEPDTDAKEGRAIAQKKDDNKKGDQNNSGKQGNAKKGNEKKGNEKKGKKEVNEKGNARVIKGRRGKGSSAAGSGAANCSTVVEDWQRPTATHWQTLESAGATSTRRASCKRPGAKPAAKRVMMDWQSPQGSLL